MDELIIPYPDFQMGEVIDPEQHDLNNLYIQNKVNDIVTFVNVLQGPGGGDTITITPIPPYTATTIPGLITELLARLLSDEGSDMVGTPSLPNIIGATVGEQLSYLSNLFTLAHVSTFNIKDQAVTNAKLADGSVTDVKLASDAVTTVKLINGAVTALKLAVNAVTSDKIANGAVINTKLGALSVTSDKIAQGAVTAEKLASGAVSGAGLADGSVTAPKLANNAVTSQKINPLAVTTTHIAELNVTSSKIANSAITSNKIGNNSVVSTHIVDNAIKTNHIADQNVTTPKIVDRGITSEKIGLEQVKVEHLDPTLLEGLEESVLTAKVLVLEEEMDEVQEIVKELDSSVNRLEATLNEGDNLVESNTASLADISLTGRTLVSASMSVLDPARYYVIADKKDEIRWSNGLSQTGVSKFMGRAEKPIIFRKANFEGKTVAGDTNVNPHIFRTTGGSTLSTPGGGTERPEYVGNGGIAVQDSRTVGTNITATGQTAQQTFSFNVVEEVERNIGTIPRATLAQKIQWLKDNVASLRVGWYGYGSSPTGNKATLKTWFGEWGGTTNHTLGVIQRLGVTLTNLNTYIREDGFFHALVHAESANETVSSSIQTDYVDLVIELKQTATVQNPRTALYEVTSAEYAKILAEWDEKTVINRYPKVAGIQHLQGISIATEGKNLLPPFSDWTGNVDLAFTSPYEVVLNAPNTNNLHRYFNAPVRGGEPVSFSAIKNGTGNYKLYEYNGTSYNGITKTGTVESWTVLPNTTHVRVEINNIATIGKTSFSNPMLVLGEVQESFSPRNESHLFADIQLGELGSIKDLLYKQDGKWVLRNFINKDVGLNVAVSNWTTVSIDTGFKKFRTDSISPLALNKENNSLLTGPFGESLHYHYERYTVTMPVNSHFISSSSQLHCALDNTLTGFAQPYTPTSAEVQAYFNGWKVKISNATTNKPETWMSIIDSSDAPTQSLAYVSTNLASDHPPYKLSYVLATPISSNVSEKVEGEIAVNSLSPISVSSGLIVRESIVPILRNGNYGISSITRPGSNLKHKTEKIIRVYKNGVDDPFWTIDSTADANGKSRAWISEFNFDPTAEYTVTYTVLDKPSRSTNAIDVDISYASNIATSVSDLVPKIADNTTNISKHEFALDYIEGHVDNLRMDVDTLQADFATTGNQLVADVSALDTRLTTHENNYIKHPGYGVATFASNVYTVQLSQNPTAYVDGMGVAFAVSTNSTGAISLKIGTLAAIPVKRANGTAFTTAKNGGVYTVRYRAGNFILQGEGGGSSVKSVHRSRHAMNSGADAMNIGITSVNISKSVIKISSFPITSSGTSTQNNLMVQFVSDSAVMVTRIGTGIELEFELDIIEYEDDVTVQSGLASLANGISRASVSMNYVDRNKSELSFSFNTGQTGEYLQNVIARLESETSINFARGTTNGLTQIRWFVVTHPS